MKKVSEEVYSDATGERIDGKVTAATVTVKNRTYSVDLDDGILDEELGKITLAEVFDRGEKVRSASTGRRRTTASQSDQAQARTWAKDNGIEVGDRGVVSKEIVDAWREAAGKAPAGV